MRTQKTDNSGTTYYYYDSKNNLIGMIKGNDTLLFYYDTDGNVTSFKYGDTMYYYVKNLQGDVVKIINQSGTVYASYVYDAWGNIKSVTGDPILRELNPFRYKSYVYDNESGLYYLQSRYYDPFTGRFLNSDAYCDTESGTPISTNMFAYCENNSVISSDPTGYWYKTNHFNMCKAAGFSKITRTWSEYADTKFSSSNDTINSKKVYCSSPFHSRASALNIAKYIYNKAIKVKKSSKAITFYNSSNKKNKDKTACLYIDYFGYRKTKTDNKLTLENSKAKKLKNLLNSFRSSKDQADALMGLALHVVQDYFAHLTKIDVKRSGKYLYKNINTTYFSNNYLHNTKDFEDDTSVIPWRYTNSKRITYVLYDFYSKNKTIKKISLKNVSGKKKYNFTYSRKKYDIYSKEYYLVVE